MARRPDSPAAVRRMQSYTNHRHTPTLNLVGFLFLLLAIAAFTLRWFGIGGRYTMALGLVGLLGAVLILLSLSRLYTTSLQDRIILLEMKVRAMTVLSPAQQETLARLGKRQIIALRFASDEELPLLAERAAREHLSADQIKRAIVTWVPDWDRT